MNVSEVIKRLADYLTITNVIVCLPGLILLGYWLITTSWGTNALACSLPRRNNMPVYLPFIPLFVWLGGVSFSLLIKEEALPDLVSWQDVFFDNLILLIWAAVAIVVIIYLARATFARRLRGMGLKPKEIFKDFFAAFVNLLSVWPLITLALLLTIFLGLLIKGPEFEIQQHEQLKLIAAHPQLPVRVLMIITAVAVVPAFEEMLFRGLFQTMLRTILLKPWLSILISSGIFAAVHANARHWPALFVLAVCLGYSYEKSGSLFRPIFIHSLFNATSVIAALNQ